MKHPDPALTGDLCQIAELFKRLKRAEFASTREKLQLEILRDLKAVVTEKHIAGVPAQAAIYKSPVTDFQTRIFGFLSDHAAGKKLNDEQRSAAVIYLGLVGAWGSEVLQQAATKERQMSAEVFSECCKHLASQLM